MREIGQWKERRVRCRIREKRRTVRGKGKRKRRGIERTERAGEEGGRERE